MQISSAEWELTFGQVLTSQLDCPIIVENCVNVVTDRLQIVYCLFNWIIGVLFFNVHYKFSFFEFKTKPAYNFDDIKL